MDQILFDPNFFGPTKNFWTINFKRIGPNFFTEPKFCGPKILLTQNCFLTNIFWDLIFFWAQIVLDKYFVRTKYFSYQPEIILLNSNINATTTSLDPNLSGPKIWQKFVLIRNLWAIISNDRSGLSQIFLVQISLNSKYLWTQNIFGAKSFWTKIFLNQTFLGPTRFLTCHNFTRIFLNPILLGKNFRSGLKFLLLTKCL